MGRRGRKDTEMTECSGTTTAFRKSAHSGASNPACVQVGFVVAEVLVGDTKNPGGPVLSFTTDEWNAFTAGVKDGEFDLT
jgi:hypothetical protein